MRKSSVKVFGHPVHTILIVFPLGLLATAVIFDVAYLATGTAYLSEVAYCMIVAGLLGGLVAAPFGLLDWLAIPAGTRAKRIGALHGMGNAIVVLLFVVSWYVRSRAAGPPAALAYVFSFLGVGLALWTGWLGGELVNRLGVGVDAGAHVNAPSSLSGRPARESVSVLQRDE